MNRNALLVWLLGNIKTWPKNFISANFLGKELPTNWHMEIDSDGDFYIESKQHGTITGATFERLIEERNQMNRIEVLKWCKDYLPSWPVLGSDLKTMARPMGWKWEETRLPYMINHTLVLVNGNVNCIPITELNVFPPKIAPPIQPPPVPPVYPKHVNDFLASIKTAKESKILDANCEVIMTKGEFEKIYNDYSPLRMVCNDDQTSSTVDGILVRAINDDILVISKFIEKYEPLFMLYCLEQGINHNNAKHTLIHQDDEK